jgi:hypothetical protein
MRLTGPFDIVSYRTAWAAIQFAALLAWALAVYWWFGVLGALFATVEALIYISLRVLLHAVRRNARGFQ